jgi:hypothetical protein
MARTRSTLVAATVALLALFAGNALGASSKTGLTGPVPAVSGPTPTPAGYARIKNGESMPTVLRLLGRRYTICTTCAPHTWVYKTGFSDPIAIVVQFTHGTVVSHFLVRPQDDV